MFPQRIDYIDQVYLRIIAPTVKIIVYDRMHFLFHKNRPFKKDL